MSTIVPARARAPFTLALDIGTSSARALLYDAQGFLIEGIEARAEYQMTATPDGGVEIDPDHLLALVTRVLDEALVESRALIPQLAERLAGVGCCTFWHSLLGVGADGKALTPLYNWSDTRSAPDAAALAAKHGRDWLHERTGAVPHASYYPAKIRWLRRTNPSLARRVVRWVSFGEYLYWHLFGEFVCSLSMASGTGLFNPNTCRWDQEVLAALDLAPDDLSPLPADDGLSMGLRPDYAGRWPELVRVRWLPAVGDGAASNIGSGCVRRELVAINVGTSGAMRVCYPASSVRIPRGLWCYRADREHVVMGGALSNGGDVYAWCQETLRLGEEAEVEARLGEMEPDGHGLTVLPFFSGERSTGWADYARASFVGISLGTRPLDLLRAACEAVAYRFAAIGARLGEELPPSAQVIASGGAVLNSPVWTQIMADVIGVPVAVSTAPEASSRGAALLALRACGLISSLEACPLPPGRLFAPDPARHGRYRQARERQERLYELLVAPGPDVI
jgi:gluconokinase